MHTFTECIALFAIGVAVGGAIAITLLSIFGF